MSLPQFIDNHVNVIAKKWAHSLEHIKLAYLGNDEDFNKREAVRLAYYALFQFVTFTCTLDAFYELAPNEAEWVKLFRSFDHKELKNKLNQSKTHAENYEKLSSIFEQLQEARNRADYDLRPFEKSIDEVYDLYTRGLNSAKELNNTPLRERRKISLSFLIRERK
jgi:hypothetical protein